jgi:Nitroreductase
MDTTDALLTRRSVRKYNNTEVPQHLTEELIKCGMYAPSACNKQPWHFIIIRDRSTLNQIADFHPNAKMLRDAPCAILVCGDELKAHDKGYWPVDCSAATQNILLAAHAYGLGACWIGIYPREERIKNLKQLMNLPEHMHAFSLIALGYYNENLPQPGNRFDASRIHQNKW